MKWQEEIQWAVLNANGKSTGQVFAACAYFIWQERNTSFPTEAEKLWTDYKVDYKEVACDIVKSKSRQWNERAEFLLLKPDVRQFWIGYVLYIPYSKLPAIRGCSGLSNLSMQAYKSKKGNERGSAERQHKPIGKEFSEKFYASSIRK